MKHWYQCERCSRRYDHPQQALDCEAEASRVLDPPVGMLFGYFDDKYVFVIKQKFTQVSQHSLWLSCRGFRDRPKGPCDDPDGECVGFYSGELQLGHAITEVYRQLPCFQRAVDYVHEVGPAAGVAPTIWDGEHVRDLSTNAIV
jgi:hypothetical protein